MSQDTLCLLGAASVVLLLASAAYLWRLLRDIPVSRRVVNMLMPTSQIILVICAFALKPYFEWWDVAALLVSFVGIAGAFLNLLFFKGLLDAEKADAEADRASFWRTS